MSPIAPGIIVSRGKVQLSRTASTCTLPSQAEKKIWSVSLPVFFFGWFVFCFSLLLPRRSQRIVTTAVTDINHIYPKLLSRSYGYVMFRSIFPFEQQKRTRLKIVTFYTGLECSMTETGGCERQRSFPRAR